MRFHIFVEFLQGILPELLEIKILAGSQFFSSSASFFPITPLLSEQGPAVAPLRRPPELQEEEQAYPLAYQRAVPGGSETEREQEA